MRIQELTEYLDTYLRAGEFHDYAPNGLQVEGTREVPRLAAMLMPATRGSAR